MTKKNMLEAFQRSDPPGGKPAPAAPAPRPSGPRGAGLLQRLGALGAGKSIGLPVAFAAVVSAFVLGYLAGGGRGAASDGVRAGADAEAPEEIAARPPSAPPQNQPRTFRAPDPAPGAAEPTAPTRLEDSALFDPANLYTIVVASYGKTHTDLAWATYEHLKEADIPVFPPIESGNMLAIFAGAAPTSGELAATEAAIKKLTRDGKKAAYGDAYRARIDKLIPRKTGS